MNLGDQIVLEATVTNLYQGGEVMLQLRTGQSVLTDQSLCKPAITMVEGEASASVESANLEGKVILDIAEHEALLAIKGQVGELPEGANPDEAKPRDVTWLQERANWQAEVDRLTTLLNSKEVAEPAKAETTAVTKPTAKELATKAVDEAQSKLDGATTPQAKSAAQKKLDAAKAALDALGE